MSFQHAGVIGAGSWGTALALVLHGNGLRTTIWGHDAAHIADMRTRGENNAYLPGIKLPPTLGLADQLEDLRDCDLLLIVTPSKAVREVCARFFAAEPREGAVMLSCTKGVERGSGPLLHRS